MQGLEKLLSTYSNEKDRLKALRDYAQGLGIDLTYAKDEEGALSESRLVLLIYDAHRERKYRKQEVVGIWMASLLMLIVFGIIMLLMNQFK